ncbi:MAG TPA: ATP-binding protein [Patescibacteria group bacterium]|nr:ATP-binding protein [Patescibacteria group bacterium]
MEQAEARIGWIDILWLVFLAGLAVLPPINEIHKQLMLAGFGALQLLEGRLVARFSGAGRAASVAVKILLATLLIGHTGALGINSIYYPIFYVPVVTAAIYYGALGTFLWTGIASLAYCIYLIPAELAGYELTDAGQSTLIIRILFFFIAAFLVNRFVGENRRQVLRYQVLSEELADSNRQLRQAQAEARRAERLAALGQLSAGLAHEIRNPLGVIKGSAEMLGRNLESASPIAIEMAGYISSEANRLNGLISRFLDFARPARLDLRPVDLAAILDRAADKVQKQNAGAAITVEKQYAVNLPQVLADEQLCEQVFFNLVLNAYQAMNGQAGKLDLSIVPSSGPDRRPGVEISVADTGPGVPEEFREQIFNPFVTSKRDGVGLGLAIVAKIVDDHRGTIRLDTAQKAGACFRVFLPATPES